jgi:hypothetical protein
VKDDVFFRRVNAFAGHHLGFFLKKVLDEVSSSLGNTEMTHNVHPFGAHR